MPLGPNVRANRPARGPPERQMSNDSSSAADRGSGLSDQLGRTRKCLRDVSRCAIL
jgi:hypothetical protein